MMKELFIVGVALVISGCSTYSSRYVQEKYGCEYGRYSLYDCAHSDCHPVSKVAYEHSSKDLNIFVETGAEYVDKEFLLPGLYQYIGTYSYEAVNGSNRTVRRFKQLE